MRIPTRPLPLLALALLPALGGGWGPKRSPLPPRRAATPAEELLRFVPPDVAFCLVARDLRRHSADLAASPFWAELKKTRLAASLARSAELAKLEKAGKFFEKHLGLGLARLRDDILGDAVLLAYRPGPPGKPELEQGLVLVRARTAEALAGLV